MSNFKLTNDQRSKLKSAIRAAMKANPTIMHEGFKPDSVGKADLIDAAQKLGINPADFGTPAGEAAPSAPRPRPAQTPVQPVAKVEAMVDWTVEAGLEEQADAVMQQPYTGLRSSLIDLLAEQQDLKAKLASRPADVVALPVAEKPAPVQVPAVDAHVQKLDTVTAKKASQIFRGVKSDIDINVYNDSRAPAVDPNYMPDPKLAEVFLSVANRVVPGNMLFFGPAGTGKTSMPRYFAGQTGRSFWPITVSDDTTIMDFFGGFQSQGGTTYWSDGILLKAARQPHAIILIDEVSRCRPDVAVALNGYLQDREYVVPTTGERIQIAEGVMILMADNTNGRGDATGLYAGAKQMDTSLISRNAVKLRFGYPTKAQESRVLRQKSGAPKALCDAVVDFMIVCRKAHDRGEAPTLTVSLRESTNIALLIMDGLDAKTVMDVVVGNALDPVDQETLNQLFNAHVNPDEWAGLAKGVLTEVLANKPEDADGEPVQSDEADPDDLPFA